MDRVPADTDARQTHQEALVRSAKSPKKPGITSGIGNRSPGYSFWLPLMPDKVMLGVMASGSMRNSIKAGFLDAIARS